MIDVKAKDNQQEVPPPAPPAYPHADSSYSSPQSQWQGQGSQPSHPGVHHSMSASDYGAQSPAAQSQNQWQWQGQGSQPSHPGPGAPHTMSASEIGTQYRNAQFAQCAMGNHERSTRFGACGIITAVLLFPIGLICLFMDTEQVCTRCGTRL